MLGINEKKTLVREYEEQILRFKESVLTVSAEELDFRPEKDFWTIREHCAHVLDCEVFGFTRYRKAVAEPGSAVEGFDEVPWQANLDYSSADVYRIVRLMELLVGITADHLLSIMEKDWTCFFICHSERGNDNLESLINRRVRHIKTHLEYIERNRRIYAGK